MKVGMNLVVAVALVAVAGVCWMLGQSERQLAAAQEDLATLRYEAAANALDEGHSFATGEIKAAAKNSRAAANYWSGKYGFFSSTRDGEGNQIEHTPGELLIAANASYRAVQAEMEHSDRPTVLKHFEDAIKNYSEAMKSDPLSEDAAYNYELAIRSREALARLPASAATPKTKAESVSIHGPEGAPPKGSGMTNFKVIVPQQPDERKEDKQAGKGEKRSKKG